MCGSLTRPLPGRLEHVNRAKELIRPSPWKGADDGSGVPEAARGGLFERGFTTHEDGTGLGLAIVESIVRAHGWTIQLDHGDGESTADGKPAANEAARPDGARFVVRTG